MFRPLTRKVLFVSILMFSVANGLLLVSTPVRSAEPLAKWAVLYKVGNPTFVVVQPGSNPNQYLSIFVSPTCNQCDMLFTSVFKALDARDPRFDRVQIAFVLTPRKEDDYQVILGLMCVPGNGFPGAAIRYFRSLMDQLQGRIISTNAAHSTARDIARDYGVADAQYAECLGSQTNRVTISKAFVIADRLRPTNDIPFVMYNDQPTGARDFNALTALLSR